MVKIEILDRRSAGRKKEIEKQAKKVLGVLGRENWDLDIYLISGARSRRLNRECRGIDREASILSFPASRDWPSPDHKNPYLGEIYLNLSYLKRKGYSVQLLTIHGVLHLLGFDHETESEAKKMEREEERIARELAS